jgi:hypothetical protein
MIRKCVIDDFTGRRPTLKPCPTYLCHITSHYSSTFVILPRFILSDVCFTVTKKYATFYNFAALSIEIFFIAAS